MRTIKYNNWWHAAAASKRTRIEWSISLKQNFSINFEVGGGEGGDALEFHLGVPFVATVYVTIDNVFGPTVSNREFRIAYHDTALYFKPWGHPNEWNSKDPWWMRGLSINMPWQWDHHHTYILDQNRSVVYAKRTRNFWERLFNIGDRTTWLEEIKDRAKAVESVQKSFQFTHTTKCGDVQKRTVTCNIERMAWGLRWFPFIQRSRTYMDYKFDMETGKGVGSWKGGTISSGIEIKDGESMEDCVKRLEVEFEK
jgi:hypothetical protein